MPVLKHATITDTILGAFYRHVYPHLGYGFLEQVYENALAYELQRTGVNVVTQQKIKVYYRGTLVGESFTDLIVEDLVIVEIKAAVNIIPQHEAQLLNYLRASQYEVGLLLNFGPKPVHRRKVFDNSRKIVTWKT